MLKIKIKENELVELIEKLVKENIGFASSARLGSLFFMFCTPKVR